ncbi:MAG: hypothetical protein FH748_08605 [Balneolaceae bacterium]|nr:hypothetical protein [Balneolaceae bacterium]
MKHLLLFTFILISGCSFFYSCDTTGQPDDLLADPPTITDILISPSTAVFTQEEHGFKDTTLTFTIEATLEYLQESHTPMYALTNRSSGETVAEDVLSQLENSNIYSTEIHIETSTTSFEEYTVSVFAIGKDGRGNYGQTVIKIDGFSNYPPKIIETSSPEEIIRPAPGEADKLALFTAKVTDRDGQGTIKGVFIRVINLASGEVTGSPFLMSDDGSTNEDETANDFVFTWSQTVPPNEEDPDRDFDIEFFAIDKGDLISDTVRTTFRIRGN